MYEEHDTVIDWCYFKGYKILVKESGVYIEHMDGTLERMEYAMELNDKQIFLVGR